MDLFAELINIPLPLLRTAQRATANLRSYVLRAIIPQMPWLTSITGPMIERMGVHKNYLSGKNDVAFSRLRCTENDGVSPT